jgi:hypothetical protein
MKVEWGGKFFYKFPNIKFNENALVALKLFHSYRWIYEVNEFNKHSAAFKISLKRVI